MIISVVYAIVQTAEDSKAILELNSKFSQYKLEIQENVRFLKKHIL